MKNLFLFLLLACSSIAFGQTAVEERKNDKNYIFRDSLIIDTYIICKVNIKDNSMEVIDLNHCVFTIMGNKILLIGFVKSSIVLNIKEKHKNISENGEKTVFYICSLLSDETETVTVMTGNTEKSGFNVFLGIFDKHYFFAEK